MLRIVQNTSAAGAKGYYSTADYYTEGQELAGVWRGQAAARLGLAGEIDKADWDALCDNRDPNSGHVLTPRQKDMRRVGYDFNFHVPKSVSVLYGLTGDERIAEAFRAAVDRTMDDMEAEMQTRVRASGKNEDRTTGNMVWGEFVHFTARPVNGVPDPHLHAHCFVFNTTWDPEEARWKAGQFAGLKRDAPYFEAVFHSRLARGLAELGLPVERNKRGWELAGVPKSVIDKYSRRTKVIEEAAKARGVIDANAKSELGAKTREHKNKDLPPGRLLEEWESRLSGEEREAMKAVGQWIGNKALPEHERTAGEATSRAIDHCFERSSVMPERRVLADALKRSLGAASPETVMQAFESKDLLCAERDGQRMVTTKAVLAEERRMIGFAREGRGTCARFGKGTHLFKRDWLNDGQRRAVQHVLESRDRVTLIRGAAGVGKTAMMQETIEAIEAGGTCVFTFAPSSDASRGVLRNEGFANADTVARLLVDEQMQKEIEGQAIWIDEAGLLGSKTMGQVFDLAGRLDARVILSGDRRQHGSVERGAALRLLETEAGLRPAEIREIQRQKGDYKQAVQALSEGRVEAGFRQLDRLGWVKELPEAERYGEIADDYVKTIEEGKSAVVVSPTHREGDHITAEIRDRLKAHGQVATKERSFATLANANLTAADRMDAVNYEKGDVLVFHQNAKGFTKGQRVVVGEKELPLDRAARFDVFRPGELRIAQGDILRITRNGMTADGKHRLNHGARVTVKGFTPKGDIVLDNGWKVGKDFGHLAYGYVVTSHSAQGKTVDRVLIGQSPDFGASSREQFYVSVSRGRERATVYTGDKSALLEAVQRTDYRLTATEFVADRNARERVAAIQWMSDRANDYDRTDTSQKTREEYVHER